MKPIRWLGLAAIVGLGGGIPACAGTTPPPRSVDAKRVGEAEHRRALEAEARGDDDAVSAALDLVDAGLAGGPNGLPAVLAGLDALVWRDTLGLSRRRTFFAVTEEHVRSNASCRVLVSVLAQAAVAHHPILWRDCNWPRA